MRPAMLADRQGELTPVSLRQPVVAPGAFGNPDCRNRPALQLLQQRRAGASGADAQVSINGAQASVKGTVASVRNGDLDVNLTLDPTFATTVDPTGTSFKVISGGAKFQIGSQVERQGQIDIGITSVNTNRLGDDVVGFLSSLSSGGLNSLVGANSIQAQKVLDTAIRQVATIRGRLGALQKDVLETNVNSLSIALENVTSSESAIRDADFASETAALTRAQILAQASTTVLSQANISPQAALALLPR